MTPEELNKRMYEVVTYMMSGKVKEGRYTEDAKDLARSLIREVVLSVVGKDEVVHQTKLEDVRRIKARKTRNFMRNQQRQRLEEMLK